MKRRIMLQEGEMEAAINVGIVVDCSFGPGGCWIDYDDEQPLTQFVVFVLTKRGILNRNMAGAGI